VPESTTKNKKWYEPIPEVWYVPERWPDPIQLMRSVPPPGYASVIEERQAKIKAAIRQKIPDQAHLQLKNVGCSGIGQEKLLLNQRNKLLGKPYYGLTEAAELTGITTQDLLDYATRGWLILVVPTPDGVPVNVSICKARTIQDKQIVDPAFDTSIYPWGDKVYPDIPISCIPNMLILSKLNCESISLHGEIDESYFGSGYWVSDGNIFYLNPRASNYFIETIAISGPSFPGNFGRETAIWRTEEKRKNQIGMLSKHEKKISIKFDDLCVMACNLKALMDSLSKEKTIETGNSTSPEEKPLSQSATSSEHQLHQPTLTHNDISTHASVLETVSISTGTGEDSDGIGPWVPEKKFVSTPTTTKVKNGQQPDLSTSDVAAAFDGLSGWDRKKWSRVTEVAWAQAAITRRGRRGNGGDTFWNPARLAALAMPVRSINRHVFGKVFRDTKILAPWLEEWKEHEDVLILFKEENPAPKSRKIKAKTR
jgi:hypothetical protein